MLIDINRLFKKYSFRIGGVLHLGASLGQEAEVYHNIGFEQMIFVEAIPDVYEKLKQNIAKYPNAIALNACVSDVNDSIVDFNIASNEGQSSSMLEFGTHSVEHPTVTFVDKIQCKTIRTDKLLGQVPELYVNFLNIDLQGAELLALKGMGNMLHQFDSAYIEVNEKELYKGCPLVGEIDEYLSRFGFVGVEVQMTNFGWGDKFYIKQK